MARYSEEFKYSIVMKMMPPENQPVSKIAKETGLSEAALYKWKKQARARGLVAPGEQEPERWSREDKFLIVMETAKLSQAELVEYCRQKGLFVEQIEGWRDACRQANGGVAQEATRLQKELRQQDEEIKQLQRDLRRKEAALAEKAALLVLRKRADAIWGDGEDA
jgi:transposase